MVIPSPREIWGHPVEKVRGFGKVLAIVLTILGLWWAHRTAACPAVGRCPFAQAWLAGKCWFFAAIVTYVLANEAPAVMRPVYLVLSVVGMAIGFVLGHVVLALMFFVLFVVIGKLRGSSSLVTKGFDPSAGTYWKKHAGASRPDRYYRQY